MGSCGAGRLSQPYARRVWSLKSPWLGDSGESGPTVCDLDRRHEVHLDPDRRRADAQVRLGCVDVLVLGDVGEDGDDLDGRDLELRPAHRERVHALHHRPQRHLGRALAQAERQIEVVGLLAEEEVADVAAVDEQRHREPLCLEECQHEREDQLLTLRHPIDQ